jgi:hypothetical protein
MDQIQRRHTSRKQAAESEPERLLTLARIGLLWIEWARRNTVQRSRDRSRRHAVPHHLRSTGRVLQLAVGWNVERLFDKLVLLLDDFFAGNFLLTMAPWFVTTEVTPRLPRPSQKKSQRVPNAIPT